MKVPAHVRNGAAILFFFAALPALADTRFSVRRMTRDDVPLGKGQCDIRLQVDGEVEVAVRGDLVSIRTLSGRDARDDGSECNFPLPNRDVPGFNFEVIDRRGDIRLLAEPSRRNDFAAVVAIRDSAGGEGRYHFRLSWAIPATDFGRSPGADRPPARRDDDFDRPRPGTGGFSWNNTVSFRGDGRGVASLSGFGDQRQNRGVVPRRSRTPAHLHRPGSGAGERTLEGRRNVRRPEAARPHVDLRGQPRTGEQRAVGCDRRARPHAAELG
jgi:hypothetical protein